MKYKQIKRKRKRKKMIKKRREKSPPDSTPVFLRFVATKVVVSKTRTQSAPDFFSLCVC